eukprot:gene7138-7943_t
MNSIPLLILLCSICSFVRFAATDCTDRIGLYSKSKIPDSSFTASSYARSFYPYKARIASDNANDAWCFLPDKQSPFITVRLPADYKVTKIAIQGRNTWASGYVTQFDLGAISYGAEFSYPVRLRGNSDKTSIRTHDLNMAQVIGDALRVRPKSWTSGYYVCLRLELYGCAVGAPPTTDHCTSFNGGCQHKCTSTTNGPVCSCNNGYQLNTDGQTCKDVNECIQGTHKCDPTTTTCRNSVGGYDCLCKDSTLVPDINNKLRCVDKNECLVNNGGCKQRCINIANGHKCDCNQGYSLDVDGITCNDVNECTKGTHGCDPTTTTCRNKIGGYACLCKNNTLAPDINNKLRCVDKNECQVNNGGCKQRCINIANGHECDCNPGYSLDVDGVTCNDVDECTKGTHKCDPATTTCRNKIGGYDCLCKNSTLVPDSNNNLRCVDKNECDVSNGGCRQRCINIANGHKCDCFQGYLLDKDGITCNDVDECTKGTHRCDPTTTTCHNKIGGYECLCKNSTLVPDSNNNMRCVDKNECQLNNVDCQQRCINIANGYKCGCYQGYVLNADGKTCSDINECDNSVVARYCDVLTTNCRNRDGGYDCLCKSGLRKTPNSSPQSCQDINECNNANGGCMHKCINSHASYHCDCNPGFQLAQDGKSCVDLDECDRYAPCGALSTCENTVGSFKCNCFSGLTNDPNDGTKCIDINECNTNRGGCDHYCTNTFRSYQCSCKPKYHLGPNKHTCLDDNECLIDNGGCDQHCINFDGGYRCDCSHGFKLSTVDYKTCNDVNECNSLNGGCEKYCNNTAGSYFCSCDKGFKAVGKICFAQTCSSPNMPVNGYATPSKCSQDGLPAGTTCNYYCNSGYKLTSQSASYAHCTTQFRWLMESGKSSPRCEPIRCGALSAVQNGYLLPTECDSQGAEYGKQCVMDCDSGFDYTGAVRSIRCQANGTYDGNFAGAKCAPFPRLSCPSNKVVVLPIGKGTMRVSIGKVTSNVRADQLRSQPLGALDGTHEFQPGFTLVKITAKNDANRQVDCSFTVEVLDKEPPKVSNCDSGNQYISIDGPKGPVTWKEPSFSDNVKVTETSVNLQNGQFREPQVYYVAYSVRDKSGNRAHCRFFVHVKEAKQCSVASMPGGHGALLSGIPLPGQLLVSYRCPIGKILSENITGFPFMRCMKLDVTWIPSEAPSCVGFKPLSANCPVGTRKIRKYGSSTGEHVCAHCRVGTFYTSNGACQECPTGSYQDEEAQLSCKSCPAGSVTLFKGATNAKYCQALCEEGSFSPNGIKPISGCTKCPFGSYQDKNGQSFCVICPYGGNTTAEGASRRDECYLQARIFKVVPQLQELTANVGDTVVIECSATGSPTPYLSIANATTLAPESFRGVSTITNPSSNSPYIVNKRLTITNVKVHDTARYKCSATNHAGVHRWTDERQVDLYVKAPAQESESELNKTELITAREENK